ncbi:oxidoreductase [Xanthomonas campestris pv. campestris str. 8004]|uniref:Oxidoreductase n=2 Tax=Xanthomonas campestris pv. campestris TaxID=340 RepID=Q8P7E1_XANCP|nr:oxidoreductase [Xanthomonas campestris pv. campestris str. ATCC 33913]AAY48514.1 oxidoreductase [Xanthomonas campestris pv. campestris str. 8004]
MVPPRRSSARPCRAPRAGDPVDQDRPAPGRWAQRCRCLALPPAACGGCLAASPAYRLHRSRAQRRRRHRSHFRPGRVRAN